MNSDTTPKPAEMNREHKLAAQGKASNVGMLVGSFLSLAFVLVGHP